MGVGQNNSFKTIYNRVPTIDVLVDIPQYHHAGNLAHMGTLRDVFSVPSTVDNTTTRTVAGLVSILAIVTLVLAITGSGIAGWFMLALVGGYTARVLTGTTLCPVSHLTMRVILPVVKWPQQHVDGPPKRFAQTIGLVLTVAATLLNLVNPTVAIILIGVVLVCELLEAVVGFCVGCFVYAQFNG